MIPARVIRHWLADIRNFSRIVLKRPLRPYQAEAALAILDSVLNNRGLTFVVMMSRQAGKNELSGHLEAYLMNLFQRRGGQIIKASPTMKPQTVNSIMRLQDLLDNPWNRNRYRTREGYIIQLAAARTLFFSAGPQANVVGATADLLLEADESQDITDDKWSKDFAPMAAATAATRVLYGTAWTSDTLLARTILQLTEHQNRDGFRRVFAYTADQVADVLPAYGRYVAGEIERLGRDHPMIRTQYFLEEIDAQAGLFPPARRALMRGTHPRRHDPEPAKRYALLVDVAGEDETEGDAMTRALLDRKKRDATALTVVEIDWQYGQLPVYRTVDRHLWLGVRHTTLYQRLVALQRHWHAMYLVVDATGVGAGLASFLTNRLGALVLPVDFSPSFKSNLGWDFLATIETGRYQDYAHDQATDTAQFWYEVGACQSEVRPGPRRHMRWAVTETPSYDGIIARGHDDLLISAALVAILDQQEWIGTGHSSQVERPDPIANIDRAPW